MSILDSIENCYNFQQTKNWVLEIYAYFLMYLLKKLLIPGVFFIIVNSYKTIIISNDSSNLTHPIVIAQVKP